MALSADRTLTKSSTRGIITLSGTVATGSTIYKGSFVVSKSTGKIAVASNAGTTTRFLGVAKAGAAAAATVEIERGHVVQVPATTAITAGYLGKSLFCVDDQTVGAATTLGPAAGIMTKYVSANLVEILVGGSELYRVAANT